MVMLMTQIDLAGQVSRTRRMKVSVPVSESWMRSYRLLLGNVTFHQLVMEWPKIKTGAKACGAAGGTGAEANTYCSYE